MRDDERKIATRVLRDAVAQGWRIALHDEEGLVLSGRRVEPFMLEIGSSEVQQLLFYEDHIGDPQDNGPCVGTVTMVFGNEPGVLLSDSSESPVFSAFLAPIEAYAETFQK